MSSFPDPPSLYKVYSDENVRSGQAPKPPALIKGKYYMFGSLFDVSLCIHLLFAHLLLFLYAISPDRGCHDTSVRGARTGASLSP